MTYELRLPSKQSILSVTPEEETAECQVNADFCMPLSRRYLVEQWHN